jgi:glycosyltransferase involved in cell wall biosynthesis
VTEARPLVSVVVPAYNAQDTILDAIDSALSQTWDRLEVLVVDDGSTDRTADVVRDRFHDDERVRLFAVPHEGRSAARNRGVQEAGGDYFQFLDADDLLVPTKIEVQVAVLQKDPLLAVAYGDVECFADEDPSIRWIYDKGRHRPSGDVLPFMIDDGFILPVSALVRRDACVRAGEFDTELHGSEDWDFWMKIADGSRFAYAPREIVGHYRVRLRARADALNFLLAGVLALEKLKTRLPRTQARDLKVARAIGAWRFGYGRQLALEGARWCGVRAMARGVVKDRRSMDYKLAWLFLSAILGGHSAKRLIAALQRRLGRVPWEPPDRTQGLVPEPGSVARPPM